MTEPYRVHGELPHLAGSTLVIMLTGWIDASGAAGAAAEHLENATSATTLVEFDSDTFVDYRARRPVMEVRDGVNSRIVWSTPEVKLGRDAHDQPVLILTGPEPDTAWRLFAETVAQLALRLGVTKSVGLGAYPFGAPHTRPVGLTATSPDPAVVARLGFPRTSLDVPAGVESILERALNEKGISAVGLWAQVPHYIASMAYPAASARLLDALADETGWVLDTALLRREAAIQQERLDQLVSNNPEHVDMLAKLEESYDSLHADIPPMSPLGANLPTVDEIAAEVEQFLRDQQPGGQP